MSEFHTLHPTVQQASEFLEIAHDFTDPLEAVREAISNSFDAGAKLLQISFQVESMHGEGQLVVVFKDNGCGMDIQGLQSFFDLGNSLNRDKPNSIGSKGHGTKVFFGCDELCVETIGPDKIPRRASMIHPLSSLHRGIIPDVTVEDNVKLDIIVGTRITLRGFNKNRRDIFTHEQIKDYILWFTKFGAIECEFGIKENEGKRLKLQGVDREKPEEIRFGHVFANETEDCNKLFDDHLADAANLFARKWIRRGNLLNHPELAYEAVFAVEGDTAKREYNKMLRGRGRAVLPGMYTVTDRYGLYLCKDFIPIEKTEGWLGTRSSDHLLYHAFINCQGLQLTANRGSVSNTPRPILDDIRHVAEKIRLEIIESEEFNDIDYLKSEATGCETQERERKQYVKRMKYVLRQKTTLLNGVPLLEPRQESGVLTLTAQLLVLKPDLFPFELADYDTSIGIDALVKTRDLVAVRETELRYAEFKFLLEKKMNHSFRHLYCVVAWDAHPLLKHESYMEDLTHQKRIFRIFPPEKDGDWTRYYLDDERDPHRIEVFLLRQYLREKLGLEFTKSTTTPQ